MSISDGSRRSRNAALYRRRAVYELLKALEIASGYETKSLENAKLMALSIVDWAYHQTRCPDGRLAKDAERALVKRK